MKKLELWEDKVFPPKQVEVITGLSRSTIWREQKAGRFPLYVALSPGRVGLRASAVQRWLDARREGVLPTGPIVAMGGGDDR